MRNSSQVNTEGLLRRSHQNLEDSLTGLRPVDIRVQNPTAEAAAIGRVESRNSTGSRHIGFSNSVEVSPPRLKAQTNAANGGIGVSYSNVVLAGGIDPRDSKLPIESSYKYGYDPASQNRQNDLLNNKAPAKYYCTRVSKPPSSLRAAGSRLALGK